MKKNQQLITLSLALVSFFAFVLLSTQHAVTQKNIQGGAIDRVVISAPVQIILNGGDPFLAANFEAFRSSSTWAGTTESAKVDRQFRLRSHSVITELNPCHEDNYYLSNALLSWGGSPEIGNAILKKALECRTWDYVPAFFYAFNRFYFFHDIEGARDAFELAAIRSPSNQASFRKNAIMITAGELASNELAIQFLREEHKKTNDLKLKSMLDKRISRLEGLVYLQDAQTRYESTFKAKLTDPFELLNKKIITAFPNDPLRIGYEFNQGSFQLRQLQPN